MLAFSFINNQNNSHSFKYPSAMRVIRILFINQTLYYFTFCK
ncbi:Hypothetical protein ABZS17I87_02611 [Kosakonia cowanii]